MKMTPQEFVDKLNEQLEPGEKEILLSKDQAKVVGAPATPTLVVAGAGSGKTEVMSLRALYLIYREGYSPDSILGLTFTRKATSNFAERIQRQLALMRKAGLIEPDPLAEWGATVSTYNSFAAEIVREHGLLIGVQPRATLITEARSWQIVDHLLETYTGELPDNAASSIREAILKLSADMTDHGVSIHTAQREWKHIADVIADPQPGVGSTGRTRSKHKGNVQTFGKRMEDKAKLVPLVQQYQEYKRANNLLDFTDQLSLARKILESNPHVVDDIRSQYQAILLDEFQDTSVGQLELFSKLFHDTAVTAVGDPNQAIYGWRGASAASLAMFLPHFSTRSESQVLQLRDAWRNWPSILEAANVVAQADSEEESARNEIFGDVRTSATSEIEIQELRANPKHAAGVVKYLYASTEDEEFDLVARLIHNWKTNVDPKIGPPTVAILARKRKHFVPLDRALRNYGISPYIVGIGGLVTQPTITDIRAVMRALVDPDHGPSVMRLISNLDLSANDIAILWDWARELGKKRVQITEAAPLQDGAETGSDKPASEQRFEAKQERTDAGPQKSAEQNLRVEFLLDAVLNPPEVGWSRKRNQPGFSAVARSRIMQLGRRLNFVREHFDVGIPQVISRVVTAFDLDIDIQSDPLDNQGEVAIDAFNEMAANFEGETAYASVKSFLDWVDMTVEADERYEVPVAELDDDTVKIMTIHQAKGLEWDKVVVVGLNENDFPGVGSRRNSADDGETLSGAIPGIAPSGGWMSSLGELPYDMRSDRELNGEMILPELGSLDGLDVVETEEIYEEYRLKLALHELKEARRLAYVAWTRASNELVLSGSWFRETSALVPSRYLKQMIQGKGPNGEPLAQPVTVEEVTIDGYPQPPTPVIESRDQAEPSEHSVQDDLVFPKQPAFSRKKITETAQWVTEQIEQIRKYKADSKGIDDQSSGQDEKAEEMDSAVLDYLEQAFADVKRDLSTRDVAEQALLLEHVKDAIVRQKQPQSPEIVVELDRLSATQVERLLSSPEDFAHSIRRPLPQEPSAATHIGSVFHRWAEQWCATAATFDPALEPETQVPSDVLGESSDPVDVIALSPAEQAKLETMQDRARQIFGDHPKNVHGVEEAFAYSADGMTIRGRYDAIFHEDGRWLIVDWKTGAPPTKKFQNKYLPGYATQLEVYRRAFAQSHDLPVEEVEAELVFLGGADTKPDQRRVRLDDLRELLDDYDFERDWKRVIKLIQPSD